MYDSKTVIDMHNRIIALLEERDRKRNIISRYFHLCVDQGKTIEEQDKKLRAAERKIRKLEAELKAKADFVEVVRCDNCRIQQQCKIAQYLGLDGYCSYGERRDTDEH